MDCFRVDEFYKALGVEGQDKFHERFPHADDKFTEITLEMAKKAFDVLMVKEDLAMEAFRFHTMSQGHGQSFDDFYGALKEQAAKCKFQCECNKSFEERMIKDRIVAGVG